jgi:hypothetical protein
MLQEKPAARQAHSAVWDFSDSLIVFGGLGDTSVFNDVHVLSLSTGYWSRPVCAGQVPALRYGHSAAMVASNLMLVFGGANARVREGLIIQCLISCKLTQVGPDYKSKSCWFRYLAREGLRHYCHSST